MLVRVLFGRYQGEIRDIAPEAARAMLKDGRAENAFPEPPVPAAPAEAVTPVQRPTSVIEYEVEEHPWASEEGNAPSLPQREREPATQLEPPAAAEATPAPKRRKGSRA